LLDLTYVFTQSGKSNFNYIYGVGLFGSASLYTLLNLMSEQGIDAYRVASVLGYCLLPMVGVGTVSVLVALEYVPVISLMPMLIPQTAGHSDTCSLSYPYYGARIPLLGFS
jgi:hypothetical protein